MIRVLFPMHGLVAWNGGLDLARMIVSSLEHPRVTQEIDLHFAFPRTRSPRTWFNSATRYWHFLLAGSSETARVSGNADALLDVARNVTSGHRAVTCANSSAGIREAARIISADIVFPSMLPPEGRAPKWVGYIFDFQHRYLPEYFSVRTRRNRDKRFSELAKSSDRIIVNSNSVAADVTRFLGVSPDRVFAMPFSPYTKAWWFKTNPADVQLRYSITGPYILISNHFWKHKDHATAIRAFAQLTNQLANDNLQLVLTGDPVDHRDPGHYRQLLALTEHLRVRRRAHFLGLIPKADQIALLRGCLVLWQPTLFEGGPGGGSTYEAVGLGIPTVLSDIKINREVHSRFVRFFQVGNANDLAFQTRILLNNLPEKPTDDALIANGDHNLMYLGMALTGFLKRTINHA